MVQLDVKSQQQQDQNTDDQPSTPTILPLLDIVANKWSAPGNTTLHQLDASSVRTLRNEGIHFFGSAQRLNCAMGDEYAALVTTCDVSGGMELSLTQEFPSNDPSLWSPLDRIRFKAEA
jgi:hypothetical protein